MGTVKIINWLEGKDSSPIFYPCATHTVFALFMHLIKENEAQHID